MQVDTILLAAGLHPRLDLASMFKFRTLNTPGLGGKVPVHNQYMQSSCRNVYVAGDAAGVEEASTALDEGRLAGVHGALSLRGIAREQQETFLKLQASLADLRSGQVGKLRQESKAALIREGERKNVQRP